MFSVVWSTCSDVTPEAELGPQLTLVKLEDLSDYFQLEYIVVNEYIVK